MYTAKVHSSKGGSNHKGECNEASVHPSQTRFWGRSQARRVSGMETLRPGYWCPTRIPSEESLSQKAH